MKRLLIATIARDVDQTIARWAEQVEQLAALVKSEYVCDLSVVENDSVDHTATCLRMMEPGFAMAFDRVWITTDTLGTQRYPSVWSEDRLRNLAASRQRCLDQVGDALQTFDKVAWIEPDVTYDPRWCQELVLARHPLAAGLGEPDVYSGWSLRSEANPKESTFLYDTCATRATDRDTCWDVNEANGTWRGATVIPTDLGGPDAMCLHPVWSTFNCFAVYNARPFIDGARWGFVNHRLNTGQEWVDDGANGRGTIDADTAVMCERFRARGYSKVYLNTNCLIRHA